MVEEEEVAERDFCCRARVRRCTVQKLCSTHSINTETSHVGEYSLAVLLKICDV